MEAGCLIGLLSLLALEDIRSKRIPMLPVFLCGIVGVILHMIFQTHSIGEIVGGLLVGVVLYAISIFTNGKIGKGDGFLFMVTGVYLGFWNNLLLLWFSCVLAGVIGVFILVIKKKKRGYQLPFVPFVWISVLVLIALEGGQVI